MRTFHGWHVVGCAFVVAMCGFGFGLYGPGVYLASLSAHGWPIAVVSSAVALYYGSAAVWTMFVGDAIDRLGPRRVVLAGALAMATGVGLLTVVQARWQLYAAFLVMSLGWASANGAAVSAIVAPWFDARRGLAISLALNGGSCGGILVTPMLAFLIARHGFRLGIALSLAAMLAVLVPVALVGLARRPDAAPSRDGVPPPEPWRRRHALHDRAFLSISIPFVLAFVAQVGFLTHQVTYLTPLVGMQSAALAVSATTIAALVGRTVTGLFVDRLDRRAVSSANFLLQAGGLAILLASDSTPGLYLGCILFGLAVGNTNTLPQLIVQREFPREHFSRVVSLVVALNQFSFALGPLLLGHLQSSTGTYQAPLAVCILIELAAALLVVLGRRK